MRDNKEKEVMVKNPKHKIFHRHGPDPQLPPCKGKHILFHKKSKRIIMRCGDGATTTRWVQKLDEATQLEKSLSTPVDSENEDMYQNAGILS